MVNTSLQAYFLKNISQIHLQVENIAADETVIFTERYRNYARQKMDREIKHDLRALEKYRAYIVNRAVQAQCYYNNSTRGGKFRHSSNSPHIRQPLHYFI